MKTPFNRRHALRALASVAVAATSLSSGTGMALAAAGSVGRTRPPVPVLMTLSHGFTLPSELSAGWIPFEVTTPDVVSGGFLHYLQGFQIREGVTVEQVVDDFRLALSSSASDRILGFQGLLRDAELVGGAAADFATPVTATLPLAAGTHYFIDLNDFFVAGQTVNVQRVQVTGNFEGRPPPGGLEKVTIVGAKGPHRFVTHRKMPVAEAWVVTNLSQGIHELALQRVQPAATDADIQRFFEGSGHSPFAESNFLGMAALSPGRTALLQVPSLLAGPYAMLCFASDPQTGVPYAVAGTHRVVDRVA